MDWNDQMFVRIQKLTFNNYVNANVMQELVNIEKPCVPFTNLDIAKNLQYIFTSNKMLFIHKLSRKYINKHSITK